MEVKRVALGKGHPVFATSLNNLAALYYTLGRYEDALPLIDQAVAIFEAALPAGHPDIDIARNVQAGIRAALGDA
jgi:tetratricopeptide (TPR) repeat protein